MKVIIVKSKILKAKFIIKISKPLLSLNHKRGEVKMVQVFAEGEESEVDYFLFEECEGEWKLKIDSSFVCFKSRIKAMYVELLISNESVYLDGLLEGLSKI